ncbi:MAG: UDP-4-amino-4,6-dideoxy-N-acetyl-beta-L-altrosamine N-acetyltransferase [Bacteroidota bacterium]
MDIKLSPLTNDDLELIRNWRSSKEVADYMYTDGQISEEQQKNWYSKISKDETSKYWIIEYDNKKLGLAWLTDINKTLNSCFWAFYLGDTSVRGAGIGGKVEYQVLKYVFDELNLNKLRCEVFIFNESVIKMHEKFGFRREAFYREHCYKNGKFHDVVGLAILKSEWSFIKESIYEKVYKHS